LARSILAKAYPAKAPKTTRAIEPGGMPWGIPFPARRPGACIQGFAVERSSRHLDSREGTTVETRLQCLTGMWYEGNDLSTLSSSSMSPALKRTRERIPGGSR
jgi:hypothetical protein